MKRITIPIRKKKLSPYAKQMRSDMEDQMIFQTGKYPKSFKEVSYWTKKTYPNLHKHLYHRDVVNVSDLGVGKWKKK
jgi:hypothetical protein